MNGTVIIIIGVLLALVIIGIILWVIRRNRKEPSSSAPYSPPAVDWGSPTDDWCGAGGGATIPGSGSPSDDWGSPAPCYDVASMSGESEGHEPRNMTDQEGPEAMPKDASAPQTLPLRVDAALPNAVILDQVFELAVAIRHKTSPVLAEEDLPRVKSGDVYVLLPPWQTHVRIGIQISAPNCEISGPDSYVVLLHAHADSPVFYFQLIPQRIGRISVVVKVYQEDALLGSARVHTTAEKHLVGEVTMEVTSHRVFDVTPSLYKRLCETLRRCDPFGSDEALRSIFISRGLSAWHDSLPDANSPHDRALKTIDFLRDKYTADQENALVLLLRALSEYMNYNDARHQSLRELADELEGQLRDNR